MWDILGIAAILGKEAVGRTPCGCGECHKRLDLAIRIGRPVNSDWLVHFVVPAVRFWENKGMPAGSQALAASPPFSSIG